MFSACLEGWEGTEHERELEQHKEEHTQAHVQSAAALVKGPQQEGDVREMRAWTAAAAE